jgi:hypothetical protein
VEFQACQMHNEEMGIWGLSNWDFHISFSGLFSASLLRNNDFPLSLEFDQNWIFLHTNRAKRALFVVWARWAVLRLTKREKNDVRQIVSKIR